jgi:EAL domain-containing protein (putative c-di-GMP-specific phosphodiesterase class I)
VAQAQTVAEKIKAAISQPFMFGARQLHKTSSIGIAIFRAGPDNANEVVQRAEIAMNQAKEVGRNTKRFFAPALQAKVNARAVLDEDLRQAIKSHQFLLYFQPQVEKNNLIGVEVLLRWAHPSRGILAPGEFIVQAEETGLILPLGDWALEASCTQIAAWGKRAEMASVPVAVNISARQFRQSNFVHQVLAALERTGANPERLVLELTEGMFVENFEDVSAKMAVLKSHGLSFSMDDFGTGYSSLAYLKKLPLDQLKIDRAFVRDVVSDVVSGAIAQTIIALGKAMTLSVIAEGVETEKQRAFLMGLGCHSFQGYLFSRPVPLNEFESWSVGRSRNQRVPNLDSETFNRKIGNGIEKGVQSTLTSSDSPALLNERRTVQRGRHR